MSEVKSLHVCSTHKWKSTPPKTKDDPTEAQQYRDHLKEKAHSFKGVTFCDDCNETDIPISPGKVGNYFKSCVPISFCPGCQKERDVARKAAAKEAKS